MTTLQKQRIETLVSHIARNRQYRVFRALKKTYSEAEVFLVGGAVRDVLMGRETKDYDFVVRGVGKTGLERFLRGYGSVHLVGKKFGVFKFVAKEAKGEVIDIALPRTESPIAHTGQYRDFAIKTDARLPIAEDLARRDFTVNAIALNIFTKELVDPFDGVKDVQQKILRAVGDPAERFAEDYSRMLRAIRFACQLGYTIESETWSALVSRASRLMDSVPPEAISREVIRALTAAPVVALDLLEQGGVIAAVMPELLTMKDCPQDPGWHSEGDVWVHARLALQLLAGKEFKKEFGGEIHSPLLVMAVLLHDIGKPATIMTPERDGTDRIRFHGHDRVGAEIARRMAERLRFAAVEDMSVSADDLYWLVDHHLVLLNGEVKDMKNRTIEKYFFDDPMRGDVLRKLMFLDGMASVRADGASSLDKFYELKGRLKKLSALNGSKRELPPPLLNGDEIMKTAKITAGKRVGELIELLREEQLAGRVKTKQAARAHIAALAN